jgi:formylglycine-generating enzyme
MLRICAESLHAPSTKAAAAIVCVALTLWASVPRIAAATAKRCVQGMVLVSGQYCIDAYEASVEEKRAGRWAHHSPYDSVHGLQVRAVSKRHVVPQGYISRNEADGACAASRKRLCTDAEWLKACKGRQPTRYPYADDHRDGMCNDAGVSPLNHYYSSVNGPPDESTYGWGPMNDPRLNQLAGTVARTAVFRHCTNGFHVFDMVGNLHEWVDDPAGTFRGGYYLDTRINGEGCDYHTVAHNADYHDYSTGFRCCADPR